MSRRASGRRRGGGLPFNLFDHELVPKHEIVPPEEREEIFKKYHATPDKFPKIRASDPAVRALGARPGDLIRIVRKSPTAGIAVFYRIVVE